jgi:hypothetical protein
MSVVAVALKICYRCERKPDAENHTLLALNVTVFRVIVQCSPYVSHRFGRAWFLRNIGINTDYAAL